MASRPNSAFFAVALNTPLPPDLDDPAPRSGLPHHHADYMADAEHPEGSDQVEHVRADQLEELEQLSTPLTLAPTPLPTEPSTAAPLLPPNPLFAIGRPFAPFGDSPRDSYRDSYAPSTTASAAGLTLPVSTSTPAHIPALTQEPDAPSNKEFTTGVETPDPDADSQKANPLNRRRRLLWAGLALGSLILVILAVMLPVYFTVIRPNDNKKSNTSSGGSNGGATSTGPAGAPEPTGTNPGQTGATTGGDGSIVTTADGQTFTYVNKFGGFWVSDPKDPFNNNARPNTWTPPLNTSWDYANDQIMGVNLGGLFVLEPFIAPALFEKYQNLAFPVVDEWSISMAMAQDTSPGGGLAQLEAHYDTFITEEDIAEIAGAGLNWLRVPLPFWAVQKFDGEPFLEKVCWKYFVRLVGWARKYGLRINLDLHTIPGSQNGYNHSGKSGQINFLRGVMGIANAQRALDYIRVITEFISQPEYRDVVPMFGVVNEPILDAVGREQLTRFYLQVHDTMRGITGFGAGNGPFISIHDSFNPITSWSDFLPGSDRIALDTHPYFAFNNQPNTDPLSTWPLRACTDLASALNSSRGSFGVSYAGEFSNAINDCGYYLKGVANTGVTYGGDCNDWTDSSQWTQVTKDGLKEFALASMDKLQHWFFWTWKVGNSSLTNSVRAPLWSYQAGLRGGWMPTDPREASGKCAALGAPGTPFDGTYSAWQTGGAGAGTISAAVSASFSQWPPPEITGLGDAALAPTYTATGPVPTLTASDGLDGWFDAADTARGVVPVAGCTYPDAWAEDDLPAPTAVCTGPAAVARRTAVPEPVMTSPPS